MDAEELDWGSKARRRWPRSTIDGRGRFAVVPCAYPMAGKMVYPCISLFGIRTEAEQARKSMTCPAKSLCIGTHELVDLENWKRI